MQGGGTLDKYFDEAELVSHEKDLIIAEYKYEIALKQGAEHEFRQANSKLSNLENKISLLEGDKLQTQQEVQKILEGQEKTIHHVRQTLEKQNDIVLQKLEQLKQLQGENAKLNEQLETLNQDPEGWKDRLDQAAEETKRIRGEKRELEGNLDKAREEQRNLASQARTLERNLKQVEATLQVGQGDIQEVEKGIAALENARETQNKKNQELIESIKQLEDEIAKFEEEDQNGKKKLEELEEAKRALEQESSDALKRLHQAVKDFEHLEQQENAMKAEERKLQKQVDFKESYLANAKEKLDVINRDTGDLQETAEKLVGDLKKVEEAIDLQIGRRQLLLDQLRQIKEENNEFRELLNARKARIDALLPQGQGRGHRREGGQDYTD